MSFILSSEQFPNENLKESKDTKDPKEKDEFSTKEMEEYCLKRKSDIF